ncbi:IS66 family insertion sequence element accessory protein TnpB [Lachnospiraceae bacterium OttesenSCG-928-D06]|nr:IS66 family insertion sequence element accessory protein TnpB [Lachnospiraceae bacterium OttesenSCG-928-D06]
MNYPRNLSASDQHWFDLIKQCRTSGKSDSQWLLENNIKSPTFYYHVKKLREKACEIPSNTYFLRNDVQVVVPLAVEDQTTTLAEPLNVVSAADTTIRLNIQGISVEIANNATQEVIQNTLAALRYIC